MDFPKDSTLTPEEKVRIYEETCAKGLNISVEEATKKMYACSTTIYTGFQAVMTEEESRKFEGLPEVLFVLPDSYIDPVNREYGGDKYIDGTLIPRPPSLRWYKSTYQERRDRNRGRRGDRGKFLILLKKLRYRRLFTAEELFLKNVLLAGWATDNVNAIPSVLSAF